MAEVMISVESVKDGHEPPTPKEGNTFSTVTMSRTTTGTVTIEHPAEWSPEEIRAAVTVRVYDIGNAAPFWSGDTRTTVGEIIVGQPADEGRPVTLTDDDLSEQE